MAQRATSLTVLSLLLAFGLSLAASAFDRAGEPNAASIERLLREAQAGEAPGLPSLLSLRDAAILDVELLELERIAPSRWVAEIVLLADYGPPPPSVLGFERLRRGRYRLLLEQDGAELGLLRISPMGRVHALPAAG